MYHHGKLRVAAIKIKWATKLNLHITWTQEKVKVTNLKKFPTNQHFNILQTTQQATQLNSLDKMRKFEMYLVGIVEDTERARFGPQADRRTDRVKPLHFVEAGDIVDLALQWRHNGQDRVSNHHLTIIYSTVYWGTDHRKRQTSASLAFVASNAERFPFDDVIIF